MSFREITMQDIREVLRRWQAGQSARAIAREGVVDRKTATRYIEAAKAQEIDRDTELSDELVGAVARAGAGAASTPTVGAATAARCAPRAHWGAAVAR